MTELFAIFGILCVHATDDSVEKKCMNFWEEPVVKYKKIEACGAAAMRRGKEIEKDFLKNGLTITHLEIYCLPIDKLPKEKVKLSYEDLSCPMSSRRAFDCLRVPRTR
tara:strand:- start:287 stop:610 length:324 start_codon:yes stop_codon:yes gene_type:complete